MAVRGKVLIVEDDRAICNFMRRGLEANGYESIAVGTGREAISMLASHCPDVVILDLGWGKNGSSSTERARQRGQ